MNRTLFRIAVPSSPLLMHGNRHIDSRGGYEKENGYNKEAEYEKE